VLLVVCTVRITRCQQQSCGTYWINAGTVVDDLLTFAAPCRGIEQSVRAAAFQSDHSNDERVEQRSAGLSFEVEYEY